MELPSPQRLSIDDLQALPPSLFGRIRWNKSLGRPAGDLCAGFSILVQHQSRLEYYAVPGGYDVKGGEWSQPAPVPCRASPDEDDMHVVRFTVPGPLELGYPVVDGGNYRLHVGLTPNWPTTLLQRLLGVGRRVDPGTQHVTLTEGQQIVSVDFEVVRYSLRLPWTR